jgi:hypothetical protein
VRATSGSLVASSGGRCSYPEDAVAGVAGLHQPILAVVRHSP